MARPKNLTVFRKRAWFPLLNSARPCPLLTTVFGSIRLSKIFRQAYPSVTLEVPFQCAGKESKTSFEPGLPFSAPPPACAGGRSGPEAAAPAGLARRLSRLRCPRRRRALRAGRRAWCRGYGCTQFAQAGAQVQVRETETGRQMGREGGGYSKEEGNHPVPTLYSS